MKTGCSIEGEAWGAVRRSYLTDYRFPRMDAVIPERQKHPARFALSSGGSRVGHKEVVNRYACGAIAPEQDRW
jgi:hypothetical protein